MIPDIPIMIGIKRVEIRYSELLTPAKYKSLILFFSFSSATMVKIKLPTERVKIIGRHTNKINSVVIALYGNAFSYRKTNKYGNNIKIKNCGLVIIWRDLNQSILIILFII